MNKVFSILLDVVAVIICLPFIAALLVTAVCLVFPAIATAIQYPFLTTAQQKAIRDYMHNLSQLVRNKQVREGGNF